MHVCNRTKTLLQHSSGAFPLQATMAVRLLRSWWPVPLLQMNTRWAPLGVRHIHHRLKLHLPSPPLPSPPLPSPPLPSPPLPSPPLPSPPLPSPPSLPSPPLPSPPLPSPPLPSSPQVLLVTSSFMSPVDSKAWSNTSRVRIFGEDQVVP